MSLATIFNIKHARNSFSSLTTEDKIFVASDKNRAVCARLKAFSLLIMRFGKIKIVMPQNGIQVKKVFHEGAQRAFIASHYFDFQTRKCAYSMAFFTNCL